MSSVLINVRIPFSLKELLIADCERNNATISEAVREIIHEYYESNENMEETEKSSKHFVNSDDFKSLFKWLVEKRVSPNDFSSRSALIDLKGVLLNIRENEQFPVFIQMEFSKVLNELSFAIINISEKGSYFSFGQPTSKNPFNYSLVIDFILTHNLCNTVFI